MTEGRITRPSTPPPTPAEPASGPAIIATTTPPITEPTLTSTTAGISPTTREVLETRDALTALESALEPAAPTEGAVSGPRERLREGLTRFEAIRESNPDAARSLLQDTLRPLVDQIREQPHPSGSGHLEDLRLLRRYYHDAIDFAMAHREYPSGLAYEGEIYEHGEAHTVDRHRHVHLPDEATQALEKELGEVEASMAAYRDQLRGLLRAATGSPATAAQIDQARICAELSSELGHFAGLTMDLRVWSERLSSLPSEALTAENRINNYGRMLSFWMEVQDRVTGRVETLHGSAPMTVSAEEILTIMRGLRENITAAFREIEPAEPIRTHIMQIITQFIEFNDHSLASRLNTASLREYAYQIEAAAHLYEEARAMEDPNERRAQLMSLLPTFADLRSEFYTHQILEDLVATLPEGLSDRDRLGFYLQVGGVLRDSHLQVLDDVLGRGMPLAHVLRESPSFGEPEEQIADLVMARAFYSLADQSWGIETIDRRLGELSDDFQNRLHFDDTLTDPEERVRLATLCLQMDQARILQSLERVASSPDPAAARASLSRELLARVDVLQAELDRAGDLPLESRIERGRVLVETLAAYRALTRTEPPVMSREDLETRVRAAETYWTGVFETALAQEPEATAEQREMAERLVYDLRTRLRFAMEAGDVDWVSQINPGTILEFSRLAQSAHFLLDAARGEDGEIQLRHCLQAAQLFSQLGLTNRISEVVNIYVARAEAAGEISDRIPLFLQAAQIFQSAGMNTEANGVLDRLIALDSDSLSSEMREQIQLARGLRFLNSGDLDHAREALLEIPGNAAAQALLQNLERAPRVRRMMLTVGVLRAISRDYFAHARAAGDSVDRAERNTEAGWDEVERLLSSGEAPRVQDAIHIVVNSGRFPGFHRGILDYSVATTTDVLMQMAEIPGTTDEDFNAAVFEVATACRGHAEFWGAAGEIYQLLAQDTRNRARAEEAMGGISTEASVRGALSMFAVFTSGSDPLESLRNLSMLLLPFGLARASRAVGEFVYASRAATLIESSALLRTGGTVLRIGGEAAAFSLANMAFTSLFTWNTANWSREHFGREFGSMLVTFTLLHFAGSGVSGLATRASRVGALRAEGIAAEIEGMAALGTRTRGAFTVLNWGTRVGGFTASGYLNEAIGLHEDEGIGLGARLFNSAVMDAQMMMAHRGIDAVTGGRIARLEARTAAIYETHRLLPIVERMGYGRPNARGEWTAEGQIVLGSLMVRLSRGESLESIDASLGERGEILGDVDSTLAYVFGNPTGERATRLRALLITYRQAHPETRLAEAAGNIELAVRQWVRDGMGLRGRAAEAAREGLLENFLSQGLTLEQVREAIGAAETAVETARREAATEATVTSDGAAAAEPETQAQRTLRLLQAILTESPTATAVTTAAAALFASGLSSGSELATALGMWGLTWGSVAMINPASREAWRGLGRDFLAFVRTLPEGVQREFRDMIRQLREAEAERAPESETEPTAAVAAPPEVAREETPPTESRERTRVVTPPRGPRRAGTVMTPSPTAPPSAGHEWLTRLLQSHVSRSALPFIERMVRYFNAARGTEVVAGEFREDGSFVPAATPDEVTILGVGFHHPGEETGGFPPELLNQHGFRITVASEAERSRMLESLGRDSSWEPSEFSENVFIQRTSDGDYFIQVEVATPEVSVNPEASTLASMRNLAETIVDRSGLGTDPERRAEEVAALISRWQVQWTAERSGRPRSQTWLEDANQLLDSTDSAAASTRLRAMAEAEARGLEVDSIEYWNAVDDAVRAELGLPAVDSSAPVESGGTATVRPPGRERLGAAAETPTSSGVRPTEASREPVPLTAPPSDAPRPLRRAFQISEAAGPLATHAREILERLSGVEAGSEAYDPLVAEAAFLAEIDRAAGLDPGEPADPLHDLAIRFRDLAQSTRDALSEMEPGSDAYQEALAEFRNQRGVIAEELVGVAEVLPDGTRRSTGRTRDGRAAEFLRPMESVLGFLRTLGSRSAWARARLRYSFLDAEPPALATDIPVEGRLKDPDDILSKLDRRGLSALDGITDLAGTRVVVEGYEDALDVVAMIHAHYGDAIHEVRDSDGESARDRDSIARLIDGWSRGDRRSRPYRAIHVVVEVDGHPVEIQIQTRAMHEWYLADHVIRYEATDLPRDYREPLDVFFTEAAQFLADVEQGAAFGEPPDHHALVEAIPEHLPPARRMEIATGLRELGDAMREAARAAETREAEAAGEIEPMAEAAAPPEEIPPAGEESVGSEPTSATTTEATAPEATGTSGETPPTETDPMRMGMMMFLGMDFIPHVEATVNQVVQAFHEHGWLIAGITAGLALLTLGGWAAQRFWGGGGTERAGPGTTASGGPSSAPPETTGSTRSSFAALRSLTPTTVRMTAEYDDPFESSLSFGGNAVSVTRLLPPATRGRQVVLAFDHLATIVPAEAGDVSPEGNLTLHPDAGDIFTVTFRVESMGEHRGDRVRMRLSRRQVEAMTGIPVPESGPITLPNSEYALTVHEREAWSWVRLDAEGSETGTDLIIRRLANDAGLPQAGESHTLVGVVPRPAGYPTADGTPAPHADAPNAADLVTLHRDAQGRVILHLQDVTGNPSTLHLTPEQAASLGIEVPETRPGEEAPPIFIGSGTSFMLGDASWTILEPGAAPAAAPEPALSDAQRSSLRALEQLASFDNPFQPTAERFQVLLSSLVVGSPEYLSTLEAWDRERADLAAREFTELETHHATVREVLESLHLSGSLLTPGSHTGPEGMSAEALQARVRRLLGVARMPTEGELAALFGTQVVVGDSTAARLALAQISEAFPFSRITETHPDGSLRIHVTHGEEPVEIQIWVDESASIGEAVPLFEEAPALGEAAAPPDSGSAAMLLFPTLTLPHWQDVVQTVHDHGWLVGAMAVGAALMVTGGYFLSRSRGETPTAVPVTTRPASLRESGTGSDGRIYSIDTRPASRVTLGGSDLFFSGRPMTGRILSPDTVGVTLGIIDPATGIIDHRVEVSLRRDQADALGIRFTADGRLDLANSRRIVSGTAAFPAEAAPSGSSSTPETRAPLIPTPPPPEPITGSDGTPYSLAYHDGPMTSFGSNEIGTVTTAERGSDGRVRLEMYFSGILVGRAPRSVRFILSAAHAESLNLHFNADGALDRTHSAEHISAYIPPSARSETTATPIPSPTPEVELPISGSTARTRDGTVLAIVPRLRRPNEAMPPGHYWTIISGIYSPHRPEGEVELTMDPVAGGERRSLYLDRDAAEALGVTFTPNPVARVPELGVPPHDLVVAPADRIFTFASLAESLGSLESGETYTIGRSASEGDPTRIAMDHRGLSRRQCEIRRNADGSITLTDLGSTNGTWRWSDSDQSWHRLAPHESYRIPAGGRFAIGRMLEGGSSGEDITSTRPVDAVILCVDAEGDLVSQNPVEFDVGFPSTRDTVPAFDLAAAPPEAELPDFISHVPIGENPFGVLIRDGRYEFHRDVDPTLATSRDSPRQILVDMSSGTFFDADAFAESSELAAWMSRRPATGVERVIWNGFPVEIRW